MNKEMWSAGSGRDITLSIMSRDVASVPTFGSADDAIEAIARLPYIVLQTAKWDAEVLAAELAEYGAWDESQLSNHDENILRMLWIACGDIQQERN